MKSGNKFLRKKQKEKEVMAQAAKDQEQKEKEVMVQAAKKNNKKPEGFMQSCFCFCFVV